MNRKNDTIKAMQIEILTTFRSILRGRKDYDVIKKELTNDYLRTKTLDDFIINCIVKYKIHYYDLPAYYQNSVPFLVRVCKSDIRFLDEIASSDSNKRIFGEILYRLDLSHYDLTLLGGKTKNWISGMPHVDASGVYPA